MDTSNNLHIVGEVRNNTLNNYHAVNFHVKVFNGSGQLLDSKMAVLTLFQLPALEKNCFNVSLPKPPGSAYYQLTDMQYFTGGVPYNKSTFIDYQGIYDPYRPTYYKIVGHFYFFLQNTTLAGTLYNGSGKVVGCGVSLFWSLPTNTATPFEIGFIERNYADVISYRVQSDTVP
jgi:hypothetical protein